MAVADRYFTGHGAKVAQFGEDHIRQTKGRWAGRPLENESWQRDYLDELFLVNAYGHRVYRHSLLGMPRKNGKSTLASEIGLYLLLAAGEAGAEVYAAAASRDQARIVFDQAKEFVRASPTLSKWLRPMRSAITSRDGGIFRVLSSDAPLQHGLNPSGVVIDELWAHKNRDLYDALSTGMLAREDPLLVAITTAGWDRESILWELYEMGRQLAEQGIDAMREARFLFRWFSAPQGCELMDRDAWAAANPASWIAEEDLELEASRLPEFVFRRLHLNQWTDIEDAWISPADWDACRGEPVILSEEATWLGIDIGIRRDASALIWCQWDGDDPEESKLHIGHKIVVPEPDRPISSSENRARVKQKASELQLREIPYDPWSFRESAEMLAEEGLPMVEYPQSNERMAPASERIYEMIRERRLVHDGDETLRAQILNAVVAETERGWRISKRKSQARIDAAVALTMAADRAITSRHRQGGEMIIF